MPQLSAATPVEFEEIGVLSHLDGRKCDVKLRELGSFANSGWTNDVLPLH